MGWVWVGRELGWAGNGLGMGKHGLALLRMGQLGWYRSGMGRCGSRIGKYGLLWVGSGWYVFDMGRVRVGMGWEWVGVGGLF